MSKKIFFILILSAFSAISLALNIFLVFKIGEITTIRQENQVNTKVLAFRDMFSEKVLLISNRENLGQGRALNQGANWAKENGFKWVLLLDQDSRAREDMVQKQIEAFLECDFKNKLGLVGVNCTFKGTGEVKYFYKNKTKYFERDYFEIIVIFAYFIGRIAPLLSHIPPSLKSDPIIINP